MDGWIGCTVIHHPHEIIHTHFLYIWKRQTFMPFVHKYVIYSFTYDLRRSYAGLCTYVRLMMLHQSQMKWVCITISSIHFSKSNAIFWLAVMSKVRWLYPVPVLYMYCSGWNSFCLLSYITIIIHIWRYKQHVHVWGFLQNFKYIQMMWSGSTVCHSNCRLPAWCYK